MSESSEGVESSGSNGIREISEQDRRFTALLLFNIVASLLGGAVIFFVWGQNPALSFAGGALLMTANLHFIRKGALMLVGERSSRAVFYILALLSKFLILSAAVYALIVFASAEPLFLLLGLSLFFLTTGIFFLRGSHK